jgi:hypothetical protein
MNRVRFNLIFLFQNLEYSWMLTRERFPDPQTISSANQVIEENGLQDKYSITNQENCPLDP